MKKRKGMTLGTTLLMVGLLVTVGMAMTGASIVHLNLVSRATHREEALNLARSVVSLGIEKILAKPERGKTRQAADGLSLQLQGDDPDAVGLLSFETDNAQRVPISTNNLAGSTSLKGSLARRVPANSVHLVGIGRSGGVEQRVETVLTVPPFPYALAAQGNIIADGGLQIASLKSLPSGAISLKDLLPADLLSNADIDLGKGSQIAGDVQAAGKVNYVVGEIQGEVHNGAAAREIPQLDLSTYDPQKKEYPFTALKDEEVPGDSEYEGMVRRQGNLTVAGPLKLNGGLLFVDGNLDIQGGIQGKGLVVATGTTSVRGSNNLKSGGNLALLSGKDLSLVGSGKEGSYLQGLVYTQGNFLADKVSVVGSMICQGPGTATFRDSRVLMPPGAGKVDMVIGKASTKTGGQFSVYLGHIGAVEGTSVPPILAGRWQTVADPMTSPWEIGAVFQSFQRGGKNFWKMTVATQSPAAGKATGPQTSYEFPANAQDPGRPTSDPSGANALAYEYGLRNSLGAALLPEWAPIYLLVSGTVGGASVPVPTADEEPPTPEIPVPAGLEKPVPFTVDPSSVLKLQDRIRVTLWREN